MTEPPAHVDAVVVGAGFAGLYAHHRLRRLGLSIQGYEGAADVGGTWWWNRYPGARCDVESMDYSYSFSDELEQEWTWSERYATQPEILRYVNHVADRFDLRRDIQFDTRVTAATWDEGAQRWDIVTDRGDRVSARFCIMATGCLSEAKQPEIDGIDSYAGEIFHTGRWPHEGVDFSGLRVGVIGTGSSGIQSIPVIAEQAAHVTVFQRTPNFTMPAKNAPLDPEAISARKARAREHRQAMRESRAGVVVPMPEHSALRVDDEAREAQFEKAWASGTLYGMVAAFNDLLVDRDANDTAAEYVRARIREVVDDPEVAERLSPRNHPFGTKRPCLDTDYYATYNRDNVTLVDVRDTPIVAITPTGIRTASDEIAVDAIVFATGFDAMTGPLLRPDITGVGGVTLRDKWAAGPRTYLGHRDCRLPEPLHHHRTGQPLGAGQHARGDRAARRLGRRLHRLLARPTPRFDRRHRGGRRRLGRSRQRRGQPDPVPDGQLLVHGRERAGKAARVHAVHRRLPPVQRDVRGRRRRRLPRVHAHSGERTGAGAVAVVATRTPRWNAA